MLVKRFKSMFLFSVLLLVALPSTGSTREYPLASREGVELKTKTLGFGDKSHLAVLPNVGGFGNLILSLAQTQQPQQISPVVQVVAFFGAQPRPGSGTIIHPSGIILTNSHVIHNVSTACINVDPTSKADRIVILIREEEGKPPVPRYVAKVEDVIEAPNLDLAVLHITGSLVWNFGNYSKLVNAVRDGKPEEAFDKNGQLKIEELKTPLDLPTWSLWDSKVLTEKPEPDPGRVHTVTPLGYPIRSFDYDVNPVLSLSEFRNIVSLDTNTQIVSMQLGSEPGMSGGPVTAVDQFSKRPLVVGVLCDISTQDQKENPVSRARAINAATEVLKRAEQAFNIRLNRAPVARFTFKPECPRNGPTDQCPEPSTPILFDATGPSGSYDPDGSDLTYRWDIIDGEEISRSTEAKVSHIFKSSNLNKVRVVLVVQDREGLENGVAEPQVALKPRVNTCKAQIQGKSTIYTKIQEALSEADTGATILISKECFEVLTITTDKLTLHGEGRGTTTLRGNGQRPVVTISGANGVTIEGVTLRGGSQGLLIKRSKGTTLNEIAVEGNGREGIEIQESEAAILKSAVLQNKGSGILASESLVKLEGNQIEANEQGGVRLENAKPMTTLIGNTLDKNVSFGLLARGTSELDVKANNKFMNTQRGPAASGHGLVAEEKAIVTIVGSQLANNAEAGILVSGATVNVGKSGESKNQILSNGSDGIRLVNQASATIVNNLIMDNYLTGILSVNGSRAMIRDNEITGTKAYVRGRFGRGVEIQGSPEATIAFNKIANNAEDGIVVSNATVNIGAGNQINENGGRGISVQDGSKVVIADNRVERANVADEGIQGNQGEGIAVFGSEIVIRNNTIKKTKLVEPSTPEEKAAVGHGIVVIDNQAKVAKILGNMISENAGSGVLVQNSSAKENIISGNVISNNGSGATSSLNIDEPFAGIVLSDNSQATIGQSGEQNQNMIDHNVGVGILISDSDATIENNRIQDTQTVAGREDNFPGIGILACKTTKKVTMGAPESSCPFPAEKLKHPKESVVTIVRNTLLRNVTTGVLLSFSKATMIRENTISETKPDPSAGIGLGIGIQQQSVATMIANNTLENNTGWGISVEFSTAEIIENTIKNTRFSRLWQSFKSRGVVREPQAGISVEDGSTVKIVGNTIEGSHTDADPGTSPKDVGNGISLISFSNSSPFPAAAIKSVIITGNKGSDNLGFGIFAADQDSVEAIQDCSANTLTGKQGGLSGNLQAKCK